MIFLQLRRHGGGGQGRLTVGVHVQDKLPLLVGLGVFGVEDAVFDKGYDALFIDQNSGDSGHCTDLGNTMIAENVVSTIEKIID